VCSHPAILTTDNSRTVERAAAALLRLAGSAELRRQWIKRVGDPGQLDLGRKVDRPGSRIATANARLPQYCLAYEAVEHLKQAHDAGERTGALPATRVATAKTSAMSASL
jgi:hypothetical protein